MQRGPVRQRRADAKDSGAVSRLGRLPFTGAVLCLLLAVSGCWLTPVAPPQVNSAAARPPIESEPAPNVTASGFSEYEKAALRVRNIGCGTVSRGSGFAIAEHVFVTNRHVVGGATLLQVSTYDGRDITVNTIGAVIVADLALVWTQETLPATLNLATNNPPAGAEVTAVGYPLGGELTTTRGQVLGYGPDPVKESSLRMLYNDAPIEHGSSGSPLLDSSGKLVGVVYAKTPGGQYVAVPVEILIQVLKDRAKFSNTAGCD